MFSLVVHSPMSMLGEWQISAGSSKLLTGPGCLLLPDKTKGKQRLGFWKEMGFRFDLSAS